MAKMFSAETMSFETDKIISSSHNTFIKVTNLMDHSSFITIDNDTRFLLYVQLMQFHTIHSS